MSQQKDPYEQVQVRWKESTYLEGYAGGLYFPPHAAGTPSLSEPVDRLMAEQLVDAEPEHYAICEDEQPAAQADEQSAPVVSMHDAALAEIAAQSARDEAELAERLREQAAAERKQRAEEIAARQRAEDAERQAAEAAERVQAAARQQAAEQQAQAAEQQAQAAAHVQQAGDDDADGDDDALPAGPAAVYAPDLRRPVTREDALAVLGLSASAPVTKTQIKDACTAAQERRPAAQYPDHYTQITDAYNLLTQVQAPPQPAAAPPPPAPAARADAAQVPKPRRVPRAD